MAEPADRLSQHRLRGPRLGGHQRFAGPYQPAIITIETHDQAIESTLNYLLKKPLKWILLFIRATKTNMTPSLPVKGEGPHTVCYDLE
jgi:hypothetical protein